VTAGSEVAERGMLVRRRPWWRKVDDAMLVGAHRASTSLEVVEHTRTSATNGLMRRSMTASLGRA
jgi:hypothetical protein